MISFDNSIVEQCKTGGRRAQMQLYSTFYRRVYNTCFRILHNSDEAEEAMQESFLKAFSGLDSYNNTVPFEAWLIRIAINTSIDRLRKKDLDTIRLNEDIKYNIADTDSDEEWEAIIKKVEHVKAAIEKLPDASRLIVSLYLIEGYDHEEIAEILNITPGNSRVQYMRAKQKLLELV